MTVARIEPINRPDSEAKRLLAYKDYSRSYAGWIKSLRADAAAGNRSAKRELSELRANGLLKPLPYECNSHRRHDDEEDFGDPADLAVSRDPDRHRQPIVDFAAVTLERLDELTTHFGAALIWASSGKPHLLKMGVRWQTILKVMAPQYLRFKMRVPKATEDSLRAALAEGNPLTTGDFFRAPLGWVAECASLAHLGQRGFSLIYVMRNDLVDGMTNEQIGRFKNDTRQATNKPIQDFRDTFSGIKNLNMRGERTRTKCKLAQTEN